MAVYPDNRKYMTFEERAVDDPRYRGKVEDTRPKTKLCYCGKTVLVDGFGTKTGHTCPRQCEDPLVRHGLLGPRRP